MKFGSLFSGIGGFDLGFERAGMSCAWQCEIDEKASAVLARHWPKAERHTDVRHIGSANLEPVDLICGGFPCQDLSVAGKRAGLAGERSGLWFEFHRILAELAPEWVVIENVPGLLSSNGGRDFAVVLRGLVELGYGVAYRVLDAQYFGVPQRRRRVFIVGSLGSGRAAEVLFEREGGPGDTAPRRQAGERLATDVAASIRATGGGERGFSFDAEQGLATVAATLNSGGNSGGFRTEPGEHLVARSQTTRQSRLDGDADNFHVVGTLQASEDGTGPGTPLVFAQNTRNEVRLVNGDGAIAGALAAEPGMHQQNFLAYNAYQNTVSPVHSPLTSEAKGRGETGVVAYQSSQSGVREVEAHATLDSNNGSCRQNGVMGAFGVRRLTPVECERLQGFPDGHTAGQADSARYKQLGNAVAVPCAEWIGRRIAECTP